jgi:hypothetical protein
MIVIAHARTEREEERIEQALEAAGIAYTFTLDAAEGDSVCHLARAYEVKEEDAERARRILRNL